MICRHVRFNQAFDAGAVASPDSSVKHSPLKCGYICLCCRKVSTRREKIEEILCPEHPTFRHKIVEKAVMCQNCDALSDDLETFNKEPCKAEHERPGNEVIAVPPAPPSLAKAPEPFDALPQAVSVEQPRDKVSAELKAAHVQMTKLMLLQSLQQERKQLEVLLAKKARTSALPGIHTNKSRVV